MLLSSTTRKHRARRDPVALDAGLLERYIAGRTPFANFILDMTFTLFRRLIRRVTSIELLVVVASCAAPDELRPSCAKAPSRGCAGVDNVRQ